jgi:diaminopimelate decarboxylase
MSLLRTPPSTSGRPPTDLDDRPRRGRPPARNEILRAGRLGGLAPEELAARFGTPLYAYDLDVIDRQVAALREALPVGAELAYAVKANPALAIVAHLGRLGLGADVASGGELATALRAGIAPARIVLTGPGKRDVELAAAVRVGIRAVTVESLGELRRLERIAADAGHRQPVMLRAAVSEDARLERVRLVGDDGAGKFGMDPGDLETAAQLASRSSHLELLGLHAFGASNVLDAAALVAHVATTAREARRIGALVGVPIGLVDAGGGLGIPYEVHEESLDLVGLRRGLADVVDGWSGDQILGGARLLLEPGRFLLGQAGAYMTRVVDTKTVDGNAIVIVDGGVHHVLRPALVGQEHRVRLLTPSNRRPGPVTVAGPLCSGLDVLASGVVLPMPQVGDLMAVLDVGAYGFTESMPWFLSHPVPAEVVVRAGEAALIRPRLDPGAWLDPQVIPDLVAP